LTVGRLGDPLDELDEGLGMLGEELGILGEELGGLEELEELGMLGILEEEELDVDSQPTTANRVKQVSIYRNFLSRLLIYFLYAIFLILDALQILLFIKFLF